MRACLVVPGPGEHAAHVVDAIRASHPDAEFVAVWAGDPHRRPVAPAPARWIDLDLDALDDAGWNHLLAALPGDVYELARGAAAVARLLGDQPAPTVLLRVGSIGVTGRLDAFTAKSGAVVAVRAPVPLDADGLSPSVADLAVAGPYSAAIVGFGADAAPVALSIARAAADGRATPGAALAAGLAWAACTPREQTGVEVVGWSTDPSADPFAVDVTGLDPIETWRVALGTSPARVRLSERADLVDLLDRTRPQWSCVDRELTIPGGVAVDHVVRSLVAEALDAWRRGEADLPPDPWADPTRFRAWLETPWPPWGPDIGRYWSRLHRSRPDLAAAFPEPEGRDLDAFRTWITHSWRRERRSPLLRPSVERMRPRWVDVDRRPGGINVIGYFGFDKSLGDVARRILGCLRAAGVPANALDYHRSGSPPTREQVDTTNELHYDTNLIVVNADQMPLFDADYGAITRPGRHTIAYWFWDVEHVPPQVLDAMRFVDEVWVATPFTAESLGALASVPVRVVDVPVPEPVPATTLPADLAREHDGFRFVVTFDHLSVTERKNPIGAIDAFRRAFPEPRPGVELIVKSINASHRWIEHERVRLATAFRPDIRVVDRHLDRGEQLALIADADCLVSLHRSEGLGLHLIEAMWLGTTTIATRYSGNLHFMDDSNAALVDARLVPVTRGEGYFPPEARWADPDLDQAATWMRRLVDEPELTARLARAARAKMLAQASPAEAGAAIARWARSGREGERTER